MPLPRNETPRIQIQAVEPIVDCGRYPVKATVGDHVDVYATVFKDGHAVASGMSRSAAVEMAEGLAFDAEEEGEQVELLIQNYTGELAHKISGGG